MRVSAEKWLERAINETGIRVAELAPAITTDACNLPGIFHKEPADRIIVTTARTHNLTLITKDHKILEYGHVWLLW